jgi:hypothetical protein
MRKVNFVFDGKSGLIEVHTRFDGGAYVHYQGWGFHLADLKPGKLRTEVERAIANSN